MSATTPRPSRKGGKRSSSPAAASGVSVTSKRKKPPVTASAESVEVNETASAPAVSGEENAASMTNGTVVTAAAQPTALPAAQPSAAQPPVTASEVAPVTELPPPPPPPPPQPTFIFKDPNFVHSSKGTTTQKKTKVWKNLKQILASERSQQWQPGGATYSSIEAPPSFRPAKKYSDLSGLTAAYTDPQTKIRYFSTDEFSRVRMLPSDIVAGYLALRKANAQVP